MTTTPVTRPETSTRNKRRGRGNDSAEGLSEAVAAGAVDELVAAEEGLDDVVDPEPQEPDDSIEAEPAAADDDLGLEFDDVVEKEQTEAEREIDRATLMANEMQLAYSKARDKKVSELKGRGGNVDYKLADRAGDEAAERVRRRHMLGRPHGFYTIDPFMATDEDGKPLRFPINSRVPVAVLRRMSKAQVRKLLNDRVIEDLR